MKKTWLFLGVLVFIVFVTGTGTYAKEQKQEGKDDYVVGKIGKNKVYISQIEKAAQNLNRFLHENFEKSKDWRLNFIRKYIAQIALAKRAVKEGFGKDKEIIDEVKRFRRGILAEKILQNAINKELNVTEDSLKKYYARNKSQYRIGEKVKMTYVKLKSKDKAQRIVSLLEKGRSFKRAAGKKIVEIDSWISKDTPGASEFQELLSPEMVGKLVALEKGANSGIMEIKEEFYIFHINDKEQARYKPFEEIRNQVEFQYTTKEKERIITKVILETFKQEDTEIYEDKAIMGVQQ